MTITGIRIRSTTGANKRPVSGEATFSDGKSYDWMILPQGDILFSTYRRLCAGHGTSASFQSARRAAAVIAALNA